MSIDLVKFNVLNLHPCMTQNDVVIAGIDKVCVVAGVVQLTNTLLTALWRSRNESAWAIVSATFAPLGKVIKLVASRTCDVAGWTVLLYSRVGPTVAAV